MQNETHLNALELRLSHERGYLAAAKNDKQRAFRIHQIAMVEKEIAGELAFLGKSVEVLPEMTDDELLNELLG